MFVSGWGHADQFSFHKFVAKAVIRHCQQLVGGHGLCKYSAHILLASRFDKHCGRDSRVPSHKYSSTFLIISRIWNGRPFTFENGIASIK